MHHHRHEAGLNDLIPPDTGLDDLLNVKGDAPLTLRRHRQANSNQLLDAQIQRLVLLGLLQETKKGAGLRWVVLAQTASQLCDLVQFFLRAIPTMSPLL